MSKYGHRPHNWFEAIVNKLGGEEKAEAFLRGELEVVEPKRAWREEDGVIYFTLTSDGTTGQEWISRLEESGFRVRDYAKSVLCSHDFRPTTGVTTVVAVLKGMFFEDCDRVTGKIRDEATKRGLTNPGAEVACLIREKFSDKDIEAMGLWWIVTMHDPIKDSDGVPCLLGAYRDGDGSWLVADYDGLDSWWYRECGFAFVAAQVGA
ncbi:MAG: hypothetical protein Q8P30_02240 [Candidatus Uhrbacteria bacterium]|nr:hypothetical protein [Candidatus Uhrbacteria bacterium]